MGSDIAALLLTVYCCCCCLATLQRVSAAGCRPEFPQDSAVRSAQAAGDEGLQVLVPSYAFSCRGVVTSVSITADSLQGDDGFVFQIWRPEGDGTYSLRRSVDTSGSTQRTGNQLIFNTSILVQSGDTIGYRLEPVSQGNPLHFFLDNSNASREVEILTRNTPEVPCRLSPCGDSYSMRIGSAPFINLEFIDNAGEPEEEDGDVFECISAEVVPCRSSDPPPTISSTPSLSPSSSPSPPTPIDQVPPVTITSPPNSDSTGDQPTQAEEGESDALLNLNLTKETVIVLGIGVVLFVVLVVLVVVLVACIFHKRKPAQFRFKAAPTGTAMGTAVTGVRVVSPEAHTNGVSHSTRSDEMYINSAMQTPLINGIRSNGTSEHGSQDPLSPSDRHDADHTHWGRRMRSPLLPPDSPRGPAPSLPSRPHGVHQHSVARAPRDPSPSKMALLPPSSSASPRSGSVPPSLLPATVPPPASIALHLASHGTPTSSVDSIPPPPITHSPPLTTSHPPIPLSPPSASVAVTTDTAESTESQRNQNSYIVSSKTGRKSGPYDHLVETENEGATPGLRHRSESGTESRSSKYIYTYVPTEEQRRLVKLQNTGRYEVTEELREVKGYDRLRFFKESETYWSPATTTSGLYAQLFENKYRELPREQIAIQGKIGSGHFGSVSKGLWLLRGEGGEVVEGAGVQVAVKVVKTEAEEVQRVKLLQEAAIMGQFAHPNVVRLNGVVTVGDPTMIVLEYMPRGDLKSYLQRMRPQVSKRPVPRDAPRLFIKFGKDITAGMSYLARKNFVHRDLATRNILLSDSLTCKIGDFGMARDIAGSGGGSDYYKSHGGIIPVKWTAPESLNYNRYTSASDVWSYGMVLYEIWSLGYKPFHNLANPIVIALVTSKHCQAPPPGCPRPLYHLMVECWNPKDTQRPTFDCIQTYLDSPEDSLLQWSPGDLLPGKQAHVLGAPLVEGNNLYIDLQRTYQNQMLAETQSSHT